MNTSLNVEVNTARLKKLVLLAEVSTASRQSCLLLHQLSQYTAIYNQNSTSRASVAMIERYLREVFHRSIVLGYDRLPIQPVAPPSPDYIPGPEDPQTSKVRGQEDPMSRDDETEDGPADYPMDGGDE
ncbi:hypothetical protein Tco_0691459 [Tanacetum coccineum]